MSGIVVNGRAMAKTFFVNNFLIKNNRWLKPSEGHSGE